MAAAACDCGPSKFTSINWACCDKRVKNEQLGSSFPVPKVALLYLIMSVHVH